MDNNLFVGAVLLTDGDEVPCCSPRDEHAAWNLALKKMHEFELQEIEVVDGYVFQVSARS